MPRAPKPDEPTGLSKEDIDQLIEKAVAAGVAGIKKEFTELFSLKLDSIQQELKAKNDEIIELRQENSEIWRHLNRLIERQDASDAYSRVDNLIIHGLPASYSEATRQDTDDQASASTLTPAAGSNFETSSDSEAIFVSFCNDLGISVQSTDIAACHRLPKSHRSKHAPLIVRFTNRRIRATVLGARKQLRESKRDVFINEHLSKNATDIFAVTHRLRKSNRILQTWTNSGRVQVPLLDNKVITISSKGELRNIP